jgi:hypothetical protein
LNTLAATPGYFVFCFVRSSPLALAGSGTVCKSCYIYAKPFTMKNASWFLLFVILAMSISCSRESGSSKVAPEGMVAVDLGKYGKSFSLFVPDTARVKCVITEDPSGALWIESGKNFAVSINEQHEDIDLRKKDIREDEVNKLQSFVVDTAGALVWESRITSPEFHFVVNASAGTGEYSFSDLRESEAQPFPKEAVMKMYESCRNLVVEDRK